MIITTLSINMNTLSGKATLSLLLSFLLNSVRSLGSSVPADLALPEFDSRSRQKICNCKPSSTALSLLLSPSHRPDMTEIILKRMYDRKHPFVRMGSPLIGKHLLLKWDEFLTLLHSERPKLCTISTYLSAIDLRDRISSSVGKL